MPRQSYLVTKEKLQLRIKTVTANIDAVPHLKDPLARAEVLLDRLDNLTAEQATLTAGRQQKTKEIDEVASEAKKLLVFLDAGVRHHYGNRSEKLVEFGQQPFRSKPRVQKVGPDGQPLPRSSKKKAEPPAPASNE